MFNRGGGGVIGGGGPMRRVGTRFVSKLVILPTYLYDLSCKYLRV